MRPPRPFWISHLIPSLGKITNKDKEIKTINDERSGMLDRAFKIPRLQMESLRFISTIEHHHKVKVRKVIGTSSKLISGVPEWSLNINQIGWDASEIFPSFHLSVLPVWWCAMTRQIIYWLYHDFKPPLTKTPAVLRHQHILRGTLEVLHCSGSSGLSGATFHSLVV